MASGLAPAAGSGRSRVGSVGRRTAGTAAGARPGPSGKPTTRQRPTTQNTGRNSRIILPVFQSISSRNEQRPWPPGVLNEGLKWRLGRADKSDPPSGRRLEPLREASHPDGDDSGYSQRSSASVGRTSKTLHSFAMKAILFWGDGVAEHCGSPPRETRGNGISATSPQKRLLISHILQGGGSGDAQGVHAQT